jgi:PAS domain S-box-containing protein
VTDTQRRHPAPAAFDPSDALAPAASADAAVRRFAFLAAAAEILSSSLDYQRTLQHLSRLAVPALGDMCIVDVVEHGALRRVASAHVNETKAALLEELRRRFPPSDASPQPAGRVMRSGEPELLAEVTPEIVAAHAYDADHARLIRHIGIRSHVAVPLVARGAPLGVISLGITESDRRYGQDDVAFALDLARHAALSVDNARLYRQAQDEIAERKRVEEALRLSEGRFRAVMEQSPLSTQIFDASGRTVRANRAWEDLWGVRHEDIDGYNVLQDPQLETLGIAPLIRRAFAGEAVEIPAAPYDPDKTIPDLTRHADPLRWVRAFAYPVKDEAGRVREVVLVHEDVTSQRRSDERLRASEERLRLALGAGRMNVWDWDLTTDRVECSDNAREFWGIEVGQAADFIAVIHPDDRAAVAQAARDALAAKDGVYRSDYRLVGPDRALRYAQSRGRVERDAGGRPLRLLGLTVDVTDLKLAEERTRLLADAGETLGASLDYHTTLQNLARVVVPRLADWYAVDLVTESGALERVSVNHPDPARVALVSDLFERYPPRPTDPYGVWHVLQSGEPEWVADVRDDILQAVAQDAEHLAIIRSLELRSYLCVPLVARGTRIGVLTLAYAESGRQYTDADVELAKDMARRVAAAVDNARLYQELRTEDRRKDEFLATLAHELRNPLAPIRTGFAILRVARDGETAEKTREIIERQLAHMVRLVDDLLDLSRVTRGKIQLERERVDIASIVGSALEASRPLIEAAGLELTVRLPERPVVLEADRTRLAQVVSNLLNNAARYTERGGRVELAAAVEQGELELRVTDTGIGIPRELLAHIFEMFAQAGHPAGHSHGGLGIGLTLVQRLVELHAGRVWAESGGPGRGSAFIVRLPLAPEGEPEPRRTEPPKPHVSQHARRVLVVDDNADAAETLAALLALDGHDVRIAGTGPDALAMLADFSPEIAFLDIGLPGMNGYELARRIRGESRHAGVRLVAVTGWGQREDRRLSREAGFDHHLTKPVDPHDVQTLVARTE